LETEPLGLITWMVQVRGAVPTLMDTVMVVAVADVI